VWQDVEWERWLYNTPYASQVVLLRFLEKDTDQDQEVWSEILQRGFFGSRWDRATQNRLERTFRQYLFHHAEWTAAPNQEGQTKE